MEIREESGKKRIRGYAAVFNSESQDLGGFREVIEPGFFRGVVDNDVVALFNHDPNIVLGRTPETMRFGEDDTGLWYEVEIDDEDDEARRVAGYVESRKVRGSSFGFDVREDGDKIERTETGLLRRLLPGGCERLGDVGPVTYPAYLATSTSIRSRVEEALRDDTAAVSEPIDDGKTDEQMRAELELLRIELEMEDLLHGPKEDH